MTVCHHTPNILKGILRIPPTLILEVICLGVYADALITKLLSTLHKQLPLSESTFQRS